MARSIKTNYGKKFKDKAGNSVFVFSQYVRIFSTVDPE